MCDGHSHDHDHSHDHSHSGGHADDHSHGPDDHDHVGEVTVAPQGGPVILDVGGNVGAMIVHLDHDWLGHEIHVRRVRDNGSVARSTVHTGVWERPLGSNTMVVAVFCELVEGSYWLLDRSAEQLLAVTIVGGAVAEHDLRTSALASL
jgi:ABC-type Zn2+ transport system substrate-binding protein/surface adhesin